MAVRLIRALGVDKTVDHLSKFGFDKADLPANESLSLGSAALTPLSLITGMSAFANGGFLVQSNLIDRVLDVGGNILYQPTKLIAKELDEASEQLAENLMPAPRIISKENAFLVADAMASTIRGGGVWSKGNGWNGTAWRALSLKRRDLSGKTGTTNKAVDTWFTGFNPNIIATTWLGFDAPGQPLGTTSYNTNLGDSQLFGAESGAKTALPAWIEFMAQVLPDVPVVHREIPEGVISVRIDRQTGLLSRKTDHTSRWEYFVKGTEPTKYAETSRPVALGDEQDLIEEEQGIF